MRSIIFHLSLFVTYAFAQSSSQSVITITDTSSYTSQLEYGSIVTLPPTITPSAFSGLSSAASSGSISSNATASGSSNSTSSPSSPSSTSRSLSRLTGGTRTPGGTATAAAPLPSNTQPCNGYPEFCTRRYSNITEVAAHNSPFAREKNAQSNQQYSVTQQLNDGIRVLQGQAHLINNTLYYCHTSCDLLNTGTVESYLREVVAWLDRNPFEVITIIFGNYDWTEKTPTGDSLVTSSNFVTPVEASGLLPYIYQPPSNAMRLSDWPTLGEMILQNKRVVTFIDYNFNTSEVPWLLWEFYNVWETPFSPTNVSFPCTVQRPSGISRDQAKSMMYMANHNLNTQVEIAGTRILIPNVAHLAQTNGEGGEGSLGKMVDDCEDMWDGRPPNFLLVDYYNFGVPNGSVFRVAAEANGVPFNDQPCCGTARSSALVLERPSVGATALALAVVAMVACIL